MYFIYNLTKFNLIPVLILRLFGKIFYYKSDLSDDLLRRFHFFRIPDFNDHNEWCQLLEDYFFHFKTLAPELNISSKVILKNEIGDYLFNRTLTETEHLNQALFLLKKLSVIKGSIKISTLGFLDSSIIYKNKLILPSLQDYRVSNQRLLSFLHRSIFCLLYFGKLVHSLFLKKDKARLKNKKFDILVDGISGPLVDKKPNDSTHSWFTDYGIFNQNQKVLYHHPYQNKQKVDHASMEQIAASLPLTDKALAIITASIFSLKCLFDPKRAPFVQNLNLLLFTKKIVNRIGLKSYVSSVSIAWPENIILHLLKHCGVKTSAWLYTDGEYYFMSNNNQFEDCNIRFSFSFFDQIFVWDSMMESHLRERNIDKVGLTNNTSKVVPLAPMTNSSYECLDFSPKKARKELLQIEEDNLFIGVFDIPVMKSGPRQSRGVGPYIDLNSEESFWKGIYDLLNKFDHIKIIYKPKRENLNIFHKLTFLKKIQQEHSNRIVTLSHLASPFISVQCSDIVISTLITSPTFLGDYLGRKSYWYDPTKRGIYFSKHFPKEMVLHSYEELESAIKNYNPKPTPKRFQETLNLIKTGDWA